MMSLWRRFAAYSVAIGAAMAALWGLYFRGKVAGKKAEQVSRDAKVAHQAARARQDARSVQHEVARADDDSVADELKSEWVRKPGKSGH